MARRFEAERHTMARLNHPNIVPVYAFTEQGPVSYLVMKLVDGFSFEQLLSGDCDYRGMALLSTLRSDWTRFAELARDIASGLEHAHSHNLVHRDIKPGNLMLDRQGHVWITDFGLVKTFDQSQSLSSTGDLIGTPRYMSPEQIRGTCDARSDIYSLGLSLYEMATGKKARQFQANSPGQVVEADSPMDHNPDIPPALSHVIEKASEFAPEDRFQSASELKNVLQRFIDKQVPDRRKGRRKPDEVFQRESRRKMITATVAAAAIGGLGFFGLWAGRKGPIQQRANQEARTAPETVLPETFDVLVPNEQQPAVFGLRSTESRAIATGLDEVLQGIETGTMSEEDITKVVRKYRDSNLSIAARVVRVCPIIMRSGLSDDSKLRGAMATEKLARLVAGGLIRESRAFELVDGLTDGQTLSTAELSSLSVDDQRLLQWITNIERQVDGYELSENDLSDEVRKLFADLPSIDVSAETLPAAKKELGKKELGSRDRVREWVERLPNDLRQKALRELESRSK